MTDGPNLHARLEECRRRMQQAGLPTPAIEAFCHQYRKLDAGESGFLHESELEGVSQLPSADELEPDDLAAGIEALGQVAVVKLNGGLGTSMGLDCPKGVLLARPGLTFLDAIARQAIRAEVPLLLMNSEHTDRDTRTHLEPHAQAHPKLFYYFLQHRVPKLQASDLAPIEWPANPALGWCPPGHGDLYLALVTSGVLDQLVAAGRRYLFVSNVDNLGATLEPGLLGYLIRRRIEFLMEVADRTDADRKGGHLARRHGRLVLRERAQCHPDEEPQFQDIDRHRYFNTNNLWIDVTALSALLAAQNSLLDLPLIVNRKRIDPCDSSSPEVFQLESAMGAAISLFENSAAIRVGRERFAPVKTSADLLCVRSDAYRLDDDFAIRMSAELSAGLPRVQLDPRHYALVSQFEERFRVVPSLVACRSLQITGDVQFDQPVRIRGEVQILNNTPRQVRVTDSELSGMYSVRDGRLVSTMKSA